MSETPKRQWSRRLTEDQEANLAELMEELDGDESLLTRPGPDERVPITIHTSAGVGHFADRVAIEYGFHSKTEMARFIFLAWLRGYAHPGRHKRPSVYR